MSRVIATPPSRDIQRVLPQGSFAKVVSNNLRVEEAWAISEGDACGVRVASWVAEEGNRNLICGLVGYLKSTINGLQIA